MLLRWIGSWKSVISCMGLACLLAALTSCAQSLPVKPTILKSSLAKAPAEFAKPCDDPVQLPASGGMDEGQVLPSWGRDRVSLMVCKQLKQAEHDFYQKRDDTLAN